VPKIAKLRSSNLIKKTTRANLTQSNNKQKSDLSVSATKSVAVVKKRASVPKKKLPKSKMIVAPTKKRVVGSAAVVKPMILNPVQVLE